MRTPALATVVGFALALPTAAHAQTHSCKGAPERLCHHAIAPWPHRHGVRPRHWHVARSYHIPRFDQGEAEDFVHTAYPYRTGLYVPWPDAIGSPYPY